MPPQPRGGASSQRRAHLDHDKHGKHGKHGEHRKTGDLR
jgi:hypothetical protein